MALIVSSAQGSAVNLNVPTNPLIYKNFSWADSATRIYTAIHTDYSSIGGSSHTYTDLTSNSPKSNLITTPGFKVKCYDSVTQEGLIVNPADFATYDYFVLINADNHLNHHFAKITKILNEDVIGDAFEFSPNLGNEVSKDTKFMVFKGPPVNSNVVAFSAGIKVELQDSVIVSKPLFYFYDDLLDKKGELNHNTKYFIKQVGVASGGTIDMNTSNCVTALTTREYLGKIIEYSKYSLKVDLIDNLRNLDTTQAGSNEGDVITGYGDFTQYNNVFVNARRSNTNELGLSDSNIRYVNYPYSPNIVNMASNVIDTVCSESIGGRGGFSESKISDSNRIMTKKLKYHSEYLVKHRVHVGDLDDWIDLDLIIGESIIALGHRILTVNINDIEPYLVIGNHVKIGNLICIIKDLTLSVILLENYYRTESEGVFTAGVPPIVSGELMYRRAFNSYNNTLLTDFKIIESRDKQISVRFYGNSLTLLSATVVDSNKTNALLTLSLPLDSYDSNLLSYAKGGYSIEIERFAGTIEQIESYKESGQSLIKINGRNSFNKLLSPIINKNNLFSTDIIYSSNGPFVELEPVYASDGTTQITITGAAAFDSNSFIISDSIVSISGPMDVSNSFMASPTSNQMYVGMNLYVKYVDSGKPIFKHIGKFGGPSGSPTTTINLEQYSLEEIPASANHQLYREKNKTYSYNKSLSSNTTDDSSTSLTGSADKGVVFLAGNTISALGNEGLSLAHTSASENKRAKGYYIYHPNNILSDSKFYAALGTDKDATNTLRFDTINTLMDFSVLSVINKDATKEIVVAPYFPVTLGRVNNNYSNIPDATLATTDDNAAAIAVLADGAAMGSKAIIVGTNPATAGLLGTEADPLLNVGDALYYNDIFLGLFTGSRYVPTGFTHMLFIDRELPVALPIGAQLKILKKTVSSNFSEYPKYSHELKLINGAHLHTGKTIGLLSSTLSVTGRTNYFNYKILGTGASTYDITTSKKHGDPIYRITSLESGEYDLINNQMTRNSNDSESFYISKKLAKYYASANKLNSGFNLAEGLTNQVIGINRTHTLTPNLSIEQRGRSSVHGSKYFDAKILPTAGQLPNTVYKTRLPALGRRIDYNFSDDGSNPFNLKSATDIKASNADRLFLFITGDSTPYSNRRSDALFHTSASRDLSSYGILGIKEPKTLNTNHNKHNTGIKTSRVSLTDEDYVSSNIYSASEIGAEGTNPKVLGLMRLTEVVIDSFFNQIDPEELINEDKTLGQPIYPHYLPQIIKKSGLTGTVLELGVNDVTFNTSLHRINTPNDSYSAGIAVDDIILNEFSQVLGKVTSVTATYIQLDVLSKTNGNSYMTSGVLYKMAIVTSNYGDSNTNYGGYISGHGPQAGIMKNNESLHLGKTVFANILGYDSNIERAKIEFDTDSWLYWYENIKGGAFIIRLSDSNSNLSVDSSYHYYVFWASENDGSDTQPVITGPITGICSDDFETLSPTYVEVVYDDEMYLGWGFGGALLDSSSVFSEIFYNAMDGSTMTNHAIISKNGSEIYIQPRSGGYIRCVDYDSIPSNPFSNDFTITVSTLSGRAGFGGISTSKYVDTDSGINGPYGALLGGQAVNDSSALTTIARETHSMLPYVFNHNMRLSSPLWQSPSTLINILSGCAKTSDTADIGSETYKNEQFMNGFLPVVLNISDTAEQTLAKVSVGTVGAEIEGIMKRNFLRHNNSDALTTFNIRYSGGFASLSDGKANTVITDAVGVSAGFKPRLKVTSGITSAVTPNRLVGGRQAYHYSFSITHNTDGVNEWGWLKLMDLTGCYLMSSAGESSMNKKGGEASSYQTNPFPANHKYTMHNVKPNIITNVISHTVDTTSTTTDEIHIIVTDKELVADMYRVLQPNPIAFSKNSNSQILLNTLSSANTINPATNKPYGNIVSYHLKDSYGEQLQGDSEGVLSMYVILDIDYTDATNTHVITDSQDTVLDWVKHTSQRVGISDGETTLESVISWDGVTLHLGNLGDVDLIGIVSISQPLTLTVSSNFSDDTKRCLIGSTVNICSESEKLINDLLEEENIVFNNTEESYPVFTAPNFQGKSLLDAINFLLVKKDKVLDYYNNEFRILNKHDSLNKPNIFISDKSDLKIFEFDKSSSLYDLYNEIIVYGNTYRGTRKNLPSIQKLGRKTLEVFEEELITQEEVDNRAITLLLLHSKLNDKITITVSHKGLSQLKAGDIINFELQSENIQNNEYMVLQITHALSGLITLQLGQYHKLLEDRFSELLIQNKKIKTTIRSSKFPELNPSVTFLESMKIKEIKFLARKRTGVGLMLGFATTLNPTDPPLGFEGSVTFTTLEEIDL